MAMPIIFQLSQERHIMLIVCFTVLLVLYATQFTYDLDEVPKQILTTWILFLSLILCLLHLWRMKGHIQYCLDGFFWACRSGPSPGTTFPTWECETCCLPVWIRYTNPKVSTRKKPHMCPCVGIQSCSWPMWLWDTMVFQTHEGNR